MKGIVFSEFSEMVERVYSADVLDRIIVQADLPSDGAYTSVGTYDHEEILALVAALSTETGTPVDDLVKAFGHHLAERFAVLYPTFFGGVSDLFGFLETIEDHVHVEVRKLYPDAELPTFATTRDDKGLLMTYQSRRPFADLAEGLIVGCSRYFDDPVNIDRRDLIVGDSYRTVFRLYKQAS